MSKQSDKSLKRPDVFQEKGLGLIQFLVANKQRVALMLSPVLVVTAIGYGIFGWMNQKASARRAELAKVMSIQEEEKTDVNKRKEDIQKQIDAARAPKPAADGKKPEVSAESLALATNLEKQMADLQPDHTKSSEAFKKFYDGNKDNVEGWMAGISWAGRQLYDGKITEARPVIEAIAKASTSNKFYQLTSRFMLVALLQDSGEFDAAIKECDLLLSLVNDEAKPSVLLAKGSIHYFKNSFADARTVLNELVDKHASSPEATKARGILASMGPT